MMKDKGGRKLIFFYQTMDPSSLSHQQNTVKKTRLRIIVCNMDFVYVGNPFVLLVYDDTRADTICIYGDQQNMKGDLMLLIWYYVKAELRPW